MSAAVTRARHLAATVIPEILAAELLDNVSVTIDGLDVPAALANGPVILINPPTLTHETFTYTVAEWDVLIIAGPPHDAVTAWETIDAIMEALAGPLAVDTARPAAFAHPGIPDHPAYQLKFTEAL